LATELSTQLTYALKNPQPSGPFAQVDNEQLLALKKLAAIFEGALPKHRQQTSTPLITNETTDSPPRVDIPVSPQREKHSSSSPRVVVPTTPNQTTPNSHRILQTLPRRFVTPTTSHHMVRRSAGPHKISNTFRRKLDKKQITYFLCPMGPLATANKQVIIMPEMVNSVICPDTGKSLKHNELITSSRYKIGWMRSTVNEIGRLTQGLKRGNKVTNTIKFIRREYVPVGRKVTYGSLVVDIKARKE
jgi:hypothetical protein